ncbi:Hypothetical predicted protein, partial [Paramuricea clavata]
LQKGYWRPLAFWSKSFNSAQSSYSAFDRELVALSSAVQHFRYLLEGQPITVRTDHKPLIAALSKPTDNFSPLQRRHLAKVSQIVDRVLFQSGECNTIADAFSRVASEEVLVDDGDDEYEKSSVVAAVSSAPTTKEIRLAQELDVELQSWISSQVKKGTVSGYNPALVKFGDDEIWCQMSSNAPK